MRINEKTFASNISKQQTREFGMLTVLVTSFLELYLKQNNLTAVVFSLTLITLLFPVVFYPFAVCWFGLSRIMGVISTWILLCAVFLIIVIPISLVRKMIGSDALKIKQFKKSRRSVMTDRNHVFMDSDLLHTF
jgi:hypothetical protein